MQEFLRAYLFMQGWIELRKFTCMCPICSLPPKDFLFPRSLQSNNRSTHALLHPLPPVDFSRPLFPPVRHFSFHGPVATCSDSYLNTTDKTQHMPPVNPSTVQAMPSADKLQKLQLTEPSPSTDIHLSTALKSPQRYIFCIFHQQTRDKYSVI